MLDFKQIGQKDRMEHIDRLEQMEHREGIEKANTGERIDSMEVVEKVDNMKQRWELFKLRKHEWKHFFNRKKRFASDETLPDIVDAKTKKQLR